jgi:hypothetical protein
VSARLGAALAAAATVAAIVVPVASAAASQRRSLTFYAKPSRAQFVNNADSRALGLKVNPFNVEILPTPPSANSGKKGARAGDTALLSLKLYADAKLKRPVGTAIYSCTFNFAQNATCDANFDFTNGTMIAMGPARLDGSEIVLAVTGGTGRYANAHGQVTSSSSVYKGNIQIVQFLLV